jgi:CHAD domain-containing protein
VLRETFQHLLANIPGTLAGKDPEYLHQLRVGARRLRAALRVFRGALRRADRRALQRTLRKLAAASGPARDWDVNVEGMPAPLRAEAERRRRAAHARLRRALGSFRLGKPPPARASGRAPLTIFARGVLERMDRKALRLGAGIDWARPAPRHALRIRLRRLRYAAEFLRGVFPASDSGPLVDSIKRLQDLLGELNDLEMSRRLSQELTGTRPRRPAVSRERQLLARLPGAWRRFAAAPRFWEASAGRAGRISRR